MCIDCSEFGIEISRFSRKKKYKKLVNLYIFSEKMRHFYSKFRTVNHDAILFQ